MEEQTLDNECLDVIDTNPNMMVPWYLMASYAYYEEDAPILSDSMFDKLAKKLIDNWDTIEHQHKERLNLDMLYAGTYIGEYPSRVEGGLQQLREVYYGKDRARAYRRSA
jgi:hypothetical protein